MPSIYSFLNPKLSQPLPLLEGKPVRLFIDSGYMGPGPTYQTMDLARQIYGKDFKPAELFVVDYEREINPSFGNCVATHFKKYIAYEDKAPHHFSVANYYECLSTFPEPSVWLTGFSFLTPSDIDTHYRCYNIPTRTVIIVCNSVFGTPSFFSVKLESGCWHHQIIQKTLPSSLPPVPSAPAPVKRLILNNPFNWNRPDQTYRLISRLLHFISLENIQEVLIVCATDAQKNQLQMEFSFHAFPPRLIGILQILGPTDIRLKDSLKSDDIVFSEGLGILEDCLKSGALGIQIINPYREVIISIYHHLLPLTESIFNTRLLYQLANPQTNLEAVMQAYLNPNYRKIFFSYREKLIEALGENTLEALIESYKHFEKTRDRQQIQPHFLERKLLF